MLQILKSVLKNNYVSRYISSTSPKTFCSNYSAGMGLRFHSPKPCLKFSTYKRIHILKHATMLAHIYMYACIDIIVINLLINWHDVNLLSVQRVRKSIIKLLQNIAPLKFSYNQLRETYTNHHQTKT